jgi:RimJ/RimL family protein N-acetyltransferase
MATYFDMHPNYQELEITEFKSGKLRLVAPDLKYARASLMWVSDPEVVKYMGMDFSDISFEGEQKRLQEIIDDKDAIHWMIEINGRVIGDINLSEISKTSAEFNKKAGKLNYLLGERFFWGKGIGTAISKAVINWAFKQGEFEVVKSRAVPQNKASLSLLRTLGFVEYKTEEYTGPDFGQPTFYITLKLEK